jgi:hypothetical protein
MQRTTMLIDFLEPYLCFAGFFDYAAGILLTLVERRDILREAVLL